jgi:hypothetical protein
MDNGTGARGPCLLQVFKEETNRHQDLLGRLRKLGNILNGKHL